MIENYFFKVLLITVCFSCLANCSSNKIHEDNRKRDAIEGALFVKYCESPSLSDAEKETLEIMRERSVWGPDCLSIYQTKAVKEWIILNDARLADISFVRSLPKTNRVDINNSKLEDISPLADLPDLEYLDLSDNKISDISPLLNLNRLRFVRIMNNKITSLKIVNQFPDSVKLVLVGNPIDPDECEIENKNRSVMDFCFNKQNFYQLFNKESSIEINQEELDYLVYLILTYSDVHQYLHVEKYSKVALELYVTQNQVGQTVVLKDIGRPIIMAEPNQTNKPFIVNVDVHKDRAIARLNYREEGVFGDAYLSRKNNIWVVEKVEILEGH